jgi:hypothetical protein
VGDSGDFKGQRQCFEKAQVAGQKAGGGGGGGGGGGRGKKIDTKGERKTSKDE